jgi:hypothetical protein
MCLDQGLMSLAEWGVTEGSRAGVSPCVSPLRAWILCPCPRTLPLMFDPPLPAPPPAPPLTSEPRTPIDELTPVEREAWLREDASRGV